MLTQPELDAMRETVTSALPDVGTVTRDSTTGTRDPVTGDWTPDPPTVVYTGVCRLRPPDVEDMEVLFGDTQVTKQRFVATFPFDIAELWVGDTLTLSTSSDPHVASKSFRLTAHQSGSWHLGRRVAVETVED